MIRAASLLYRRPAVIAFAGRRDATSLVQLAGLS